MKKIWEKIKAFYTSLDKQVHIFIVNSIAMLVFVFFIAFKLNWLGYALANVVAIVCSVGRELLAFKNPQKYSFEWADIIADAHGLVLANAQMLFYLLN